VVELINPHREVLSAENLVQQEQLNTLLEDYEEDMPVPVDLLTIPSL